MNIEQAITRILYTIESGIGPLYGTRYCQRINGAIQRVSETGDESVTIGALIGYKILMPRAYDSTVSFIEIIDNRQETIVICEQLLDTAKGTWLPKIEKHHGPIEQRDLLIVDSITFQPDLIGEHIKAFILRDFYINFISGCGLFAVNPKPDEVEFYWNLGFEKAKAIGFDRSEIDIFIVNPSSYHPPFDDIDLDEPVLAPESTI